MSHPNKIDNLLLLITILIGALFNSEVSAQQCISFFNGGRSIDVNYSVELDNLGNIFVAGVTSDTTYFSNVDSHISDYDYPGKVPECMFVMKLDPGGTVNWFVPMNIIAYELLLGDVSTNPVHLLPDENGGIFIAGHYVDQGDFLGEELPNLNFNSSYYLAHLNFNGTLDWLGNSSLQSPFNSAIVDMDHLGSGTIIASLHNSFEVDYDDFVFEGSQLLEIDPIDGTLIDSFQSSSTQIHASTEYYDVIESNEILRFSNNHILQNNMVIEGTVHDFHPLLDNEMIVVREDFSGHFLVRLDIDGSVINEVDLQTNNFRTLAVNDNEDILVAFFDDNGLQFQIYNNDLILLREEQFGLVLPSFDFSTNIWDAAFIDDSIYAVGGTSGDGEVDFICSTATMIDNGDGYYAQVGLNEIDPVGIPSYANDYTLNAYPNPFNTTLTVQFPDKLPNRFSLYLIDMNGRVVYENTIEGGHSIPFTLNLGQIDSGIYRFVLHNHENNLNISQTLIKT